MLKLCISEKHVHKILRTEVIRKVLFAFMLIISMNLKASKMWEFQIRTISCNFFSEYRLRLQLYFNKYIWLIRCQLCFGTDIHFVLRIYLYSVTGAGPQVTIDCL